MCNFFTATPTCIFISSDNNHIKNFSGYLTMSYEVFVSPISYACKNANLLLVFIAADEYTNSSKPMRVVCIIYYYLAVVNTEHIYTSGSIFCTVGESK